MYFHTSCIYSNVSGYTIRLFRIDRTSIVNVEEKKNVDIDSANPFVLCPHEYTSFNFCPQTRIRRIEKNENETSLKSTKMLLQHLARNYKTSEKHEFSSNIKENLSLSVMCSIAIALLFVHKENWAHFVKFLRNQLWKIYERSIG